METLPGISFLTIEVKFNYLFIGKLFLRLGKWLIVLRSIDKIYTPVPAVPYLSSPAKAGCIPMLIFGKALALVYCVNLPNHRRLYAYTSRQLLVTNLLRIGKYLFATCDHREAKLLKFSPFHG